MRSLLLPLILPLFFLSMTLPGASAVAASAPANAPSTEEDYSNTPFTEYGEFNETMDEEEDTKFLQNGRLFGVSVGGGFHGVTGNRGLLWEGGFPLVEFKLHYWFDFNVAMDMGVYLVNHAYTDFSTSAKDRVDVNFLHVGVDFKYYIDTKNLSAPISFANPYLLLGLGSFSKGEVDNQTSVSQVMSGLGASVGTGLEFTIKPRKTYFEFEGKLHVVRFQDTGTTLFQPTLTDLSGFFYSVTGALLFTW